MSTTSGGDTTTRMEDNSVTTVYNGGYGGGGDRTGQRVSSTTSNGDDSGLDNSNTGSSAGDAAKLIIDVPDFSKGKTVCNFLCERRRGSDSRDDKRARSYKLTRLFGNGDRYQYSTSSLKRSPL